MPISKPSIALFGALLSAHLKRLGLTQRDLARRLGAPDTWISAIVRGKKCVRWDTAVRIARAVGVSLDELAGGHDQEGKGDAR